MPEITYEAVVLGLVIGIFIAVIIHQVRSDDKFRGFLEIVDNQEKLLDNLNERMEILFENQKTLTEAVFGYQQTKRDEELLS